MFWKRPHLRPPSPQIEDHDTYMIIDYCGETQDTPSHSPLLTIKPLTDDDLMDCLTVLTSYTDAVERTAMPPTPSNTPKSTQACIFDDQALMAFLGTPTPPPRSATSTPSITFNGLSAITSFASIEDVDTVIQNEPTHARKIPPPAPTAFCTSLTPMLLHGGIPITFMLMTQMGIMRVGGGVGDRDSAPDDDIQ